MPLRIVGAAILGLIVGYSLDWRAEIPQPTEVKEVVDPANGVRRLVIHADSANQCYIEAIVTGRKPVRLRFLMDSGAGGLALTQQAARALGVNVAALSYNEIYQGWGATGQQANIMLREFQLGSFVLRNVRASVAQTTSADEVSLLGTNVLRHLNFQVRNGSCAVTIPSAGGPPAKNPRI